MYPVLTYLMLVMVHTPNNDMAFYECPNTGKVIEYSYNDMATEDLYRWTYKVEFKCRNKKIQTWLREANLRRIGVK